MGSLGGQGDAKAALCGRQSLPLAGSVPYVGLREGLPLLQYLDNEKLLDRIISKTNADLADGVAQRDDELREARCEAGLLETQRENLVFNPARAPAAAAQKKGERHQRGAALVVHGWNERRSGEPTFSTPSKWLRQLGSNQ